ncbi:putative ribonuclease H-like domain-containing protein [Tanacetum coccineum]
MPPWQSPLFSLDRENQGLRSMTLGSKMNGWTGWLYGFYLTQETQVLSSLSKEAQEDQTLRNFMEDMLPLVEKPKEGKLLVKELLKLMCDKKNSVLFTDTGCFVLSPDFKLANGSQVLLKVPRKNNMYNVDINNIVPRESLTCLVAKATLDESMLWHRRLGHVKFKTINKLVKENLVRGLPSKHFENDQTCVACLKGKQHNASFTTAPLEATHADFFGDEIEVDMSNISTTYPVPSNLNTRIHKYHSLDHVIVDVWTLVDLPHGKRAIGTKWVYMNKKDERGIVIRNKENVDLGFYTKMKRNCYDEVFALVARIEAIRLFLAYALFKDFAVYQMDVKSAFLYGKIKEEVYVCQPPGFEDLEFHDRVYKVEKALYGLHQAPRAWYETLSTYLLDNRFQRGQTDKTLFIKRVKSDILLVQVYVDDIIFGSTKKELCTEFKKLMHKKFQMSFIASSPMQTSKPLMKDENDEDVDVYLYRSMIGSLMYLTSSRPDIMFVVNLNWAFGILDSPFDLEDYTDSDYAGASLDRKSTTGGCQFLRSRLISWQCKKQTIVANSTTEAEYVATASCYGQFWQTTSASTLDNGEMEIIATIDGKIKIVTEETEVPQPSSPPHTNVADEAASTSVDVRY